MYETFNKFRVHVSCERKKVVHDSYVDLFTKEAPERVKSMLEVGFRRRFRFPYSFELEQLPADEFLYQAMSTPYQVVDVVASDFANIFYNA